MRSGRGAFTNKEDGSKYRGEWKGDKKNGYGACPSDGTVLRGVERRFMGAIDRVPRRRRKSSVTARPPWAPTPTLGIEGRDELNNKRLSEETFFAWY